MNDATFRLQRGERLLPGGGTITQGFGRRGAMAALLGTGSDSVELRRKRWEVATEKVLASETVEINDAPRDDHAGRPESAERLRDAIRRQDAPIDRLEDRPHEITRGRSRDDRPIELVDPAVAR